MTLNVKARRKARRLALQGVYQWELTKNPIGDIETWLLENNPAKKLDLPYFKELLQHIPEQVEILDQKIIPHLDRTIEELDLVELAVLRLAVYELIFHLEIPDRVVINEALELTKMFGSVDGFKYINGVLDKIAKEVRSAE